MEKTQRLDLLLRLCDQFSDEFLAKQNVPDGEMSSISLFRIHVSGVRGTRIRIQG